MRMCSLSPRIAAHALVLSLLVTMEIAVAARAAAPPRAPAAPTVVANPGGTRIWPDVAPGSESWRQQEVTYANTPVGTVVMNVVTPRLTPFLPEASKATGSAVIVAPGGAFVALAWSREGTDVAQWLQARGIAAFVLAYRTIEKRGPGVPQLDQDAAARYGIADAVQAIAVVRAHAAEWHVVPERVGILGFSAGGMVASGAVLQDDPARRPSFAALIYGAPFGTMPRVPAGLPPLFLAWAQDDPIARDAVSAFASALQAAGNRPEMHVFASGGHGFGMQVQGKSSDRWPELLESWLATQGLLRRTP